MKDELDQIETSKDKKKTWKWMNDMMERHAKWTNIDGLKNTQRNQ